MQTWSRATPWSRSRRGRMEPFRWAAFRRDGRTSEDEAAPEKLTEYGFSEAFKKPFDVALLGERIRTLAEAKRDDM